MRDIRFQINAWQEFLELSKDKALHKKIISLIKDIARNDKEKLGHYENLKGDLSGYSSVRIDKKNRLVFALKDDCIDILQVGGHYKDK